MNPAPLKSRNPILRRAIVLGTKGIPNGRRRDPAGRPGFQLTYENSIFGAPDRWPLVTRLTALILCALPPPPGVNVMFQRGSGPLCLSVSINRVSLNKSQVEQSQFSVIFIHSSNSAEANYRRALDRLNATAPPPRNFFPTPDQIAEFQRQIEEPPAKDYRITRGLFHGPKQHQAIAPAQAAAEVNEEGAVGGTEEKEEGAVGGETSEEDDTLQMLCESLSIEETIQAPIPTTPIQTEPTRQGRSRGRGLLMFSRESLEEAFKERPRERSKSRIAWIRRLAEQ
ncbi:hypothetical protein DAPPUDRAFT_116723 [Daphnia pulex]|uniref:Uncharacterized protein n=1 Tax=Daphnia pulex TaxID=6669 RepID=E9HQA9_DAPPU|nr:hypothetical protein DAPPUDRAFT_116723 [Daphnia pulex]|eukprot:EFX66054.1 hypothetical protein DAPPUDRAFT_116723 [Daphnia pulex]